MTASQREQIKSLAAKWVSQPGMTQSSIGVAPVALHRIAFIMAREFGNSLGVTPAEARAILDELVSHLPDPEGDKIIAEIKKEIDLLKSQVQKVLGDAPAKLTKDQVNELASRIKPQYNLTDQRFVDLYVKAVENQDASAGEGTQFLVCRSCGEKYQLDRVVTAADDDLMNWLSGGGAIVVGKISGPVMIGHSAHGPTSVDDQKTLQTLRKNPHGAWQCHKCHAHATWEASYSPER